MIKKLRIYQISLIAVSMLCIGLLAFMGITAIQRSLKLNISIPTNPSFVFKVGYKLDAGADYTYFFCNTILDKDGVSLANNVTLSGDTLSLHNLQVSGVGAEIFLKIINYTAVPTGEDYDFIKISGGGGNTGIEEFDESVNPYINDTAQTVEFSIYVASLDNGNVNIPLSFEWASGYTVTFTNMVDCTATNTTLLQNQDLLTTITPTTSFAENYFDYQITINGEEYTHYGHSGTLKIPAEDINGDIEISVGAYECWDGTSVTPEGYTIDSPSELQGAIAPSSNNNIVSITKNLFLNDEDFIFDYDTGLVYVTDGVNDVWIGTGAKGDTSGFNTIFDTTASIAGMFYSSKNSTSYTEPVITETYTNYAVSGVLNIWTPTKGAYFNAQGFGVYGLYVNNDASRNALVNAYYPKIMNLKLENGYLRGGDNIGGVVSTTSMSTCIVNTTVDLTIIGVNNVGGFIGGCYDGVIVNCINKGNIIGSGDYVGGFVGHTNPDESDSIDLEIRSCFNMGRIYGNNYVGGLSGMLGSDTYGYGTSQDDVAFNSYSLGKIYASGNYVGALVGGITVISVGNGNLKYSYALNLGDGVPLAGNTPYTSCGWFDSNLNVTAGEGQTLAYTGNLAYMLNSYEVTVTNRSTYIHASYYYWKYWDYDPTGKINDGYPYFVDELPEWYNG